MTRLRIRLAARTVSTLMVTLMLVCFARSAAAQSATAILDRVRVNVQRPIDFHALALPETVYVGQQTTYQVAVLLNADARSRLRRNPEFLPPELRGLLAYELGTPSRVPPRSFGGAVYEAHVFQRALFPVAAGQQFIPAPQLTYALPQSSSYFSREERSVVKAESASVFVKPLPIVGRPADFNGAVGVFTASVRLDTTNVRVGEPLVLTLRVAGTGNVKLLPRPGIELDWASAVPGTERIQVDSAGPLVRGMKEFDWILTPTRAGRVDVPALAYSFFDPYTAKYGVTASGPLTISVRSGTLAVADESDAGAVLPLRPSTTHGRAASWLANGRLPDGWWLWAILMMLAPLPAWWWSRSARRTDDARTPRTDPAAFDAAARTHAPPVSPQREAARSTRRTFVAALATRFAQTPQALVSRRYVARLLRRNGVTRATTREVMKLLESLDELGFAVEGAALETMTRVAASETTAAELIRRVDGEAMPHGRTIHGATRHGATRGAALLMMALACATLHAAPAYAVPADSLAPQSRAEDSTRTDARALAQRAYERRAFGEAEKRFAALATAAPDDADVLANWGTAAWAAGDTVSAVIAWQRAARMQPLAADLQERIGLLPAGARGGVADVPMVPVPFLALVAIGAWCAGWLLLALRAQRLRSVPAFATKRMADWLRVGATTVLVVALAAASGAWWGFRALDASALSVVSRPETMRVAPGVDADAMGGVTTGDVVRVIESREVWLRVQHADGRRGWLPMQRLVALQGLPRMR